MEKEKNVPANDVIESAREEENNLTSVSREEQIARRIHELDIILEEIEDKLYNQEIETLEDTEYKDYKKESDELRKELKALRKSNKKEGSLESLPIWIPIYALLICILSAYPIVPMLPLYFMDYVYPALPAVMQTAFMFYLLMISYSLIQVLVSLFIWLYAFKNKATKKMFFYVFCGHVLVALVSCLVAYL